MTANLDDLVAIGNATYGLDLDRHRILGFLSKRMTAASSLAVMRSGHGYHIEVTNPTAEMLVFPVVTSSAYENDPTTHPAEKRRYALNLDLTLYRANVLALAERIALNPPDNLRWPLDYFESLAESHGQAAGNELHATTECRFALRATGQRQLEIGASTDSQHFIDLRRCLLPDDYLVFLQTEAGSYAVFGIPADLEPGRNWEGWAAGEPGVEIRGTRTTTPFLGGGGGYGEDLGTATEIRISEVVDACDRFGGRSIIALAGVPGTGKSYVADIAARRLTGDPERVREVQFHQAFSYEEFVEGLRIEAGGEVRPRRGILLEANEQALDDPSPFVLLIEELTRANLSQVLGELMTYVEHRDRAFYTLYSRQKVKLAPNLVILSTYNPSDRSAIEIDDALLRRLRVLEFRPSTDQLEEMLGSSNLSDLAVEQLKTLFDEAATRPHQSLMPFGHGIFAGVMNERPDLYRLWDERIRHMLRRPLVGESPFAEVIESNYPWRIEGFAVEAPIAKTEADPMDDGAHSADG